MEEKIEEKDEMEEIAEEEVMEEEEIEAEVIEEEEAKEIEEVEEEEEEIRGGLYSADRYYYDEKDYHKAAEAYSRLAEELDDPDLKLRARYMYAESLVKLKRVDEAIEAFEELANSGRDGYLVESARRRAQALKG
ncbi:TPA: tetratricopeptide repeat protein [Candidatus Poribacteria bacterium]|nr:tetratricopeptide repeat protein [Candidatus Poribacteria bacterium]HEX30590.1 tetratricopeptide repeat protein [Candidatus Poribacteria bacterium]